MTQDNRAPRRHLGGELVIPVMAVAFTLYYFSSIWDSPWTAQVSAFMVGGVLILVCALFFVRCAGWLARGEGTLGFGNLVTLDDVRSGRLWLFLATLGFCLLIETFGFTLTTFAFLAISMAALSQGRNIGLILVLSAAISLIGWATFIWAFDTRFPRGWFEIAMKALIDG